MSMLLKLGPVELEEVSRLLAFAKANPTSTERLQALMAGDRPSADQYREHQFIWPIGFRCVFNYEEQPKLGMCRHLSVRVYDKSNPDPQVPSPRTMNTIGATFGFAEGRLEHYWIDPTTKAFNMVQQVAKCGACEGRGWHSEADYDTQGVACGQHQAECQTCAGSGHKW